MSTDPMDKPEDEGLELVMPFVVCQSHGGPFEDQAFVAGFQAGEIDRALKVAAAANTTAVRFPMVHAELGKQLELIGMNRGFPFIHITTTEQWPDWTDVTFSVHDPEDDV